MFPTKVYAIALVLLVAGIMIVHEGPIHVISSIANSIAKLVM